MAESNTPDSSADAAYLRRLLERQPACLVRVRLDGVLLACNNAALSLFAVGTLRAILNTKLTDRMVEAERARWQDFTTRCWANGAASLECHLVISGDETRPVVVQGVALNDHPDGTDSLLLNLRDQSQTHLLERTIKSADMDRVSHEERQRAARDQVEQAIAERLKVAALADEHQAERRRLVEELEAQAADDQRRQAKLVELEQMVEESRLALLDRDREHRDRIAALETALAAAQAAAAAGRDQDAPQIARQDPASLEQHREKLEAFERHFQASAAEQARLQALVSESEADRARHRAAVGALEESLVRAREEAASGREQSRQALAELRAQLAQASAEQRNVAAHAGELEKERDFLRAGHQKALAELENQRLALADMQTELLHASAEEGRLAARVVEHARERARLIAEHQQALAGVEKSKSEALAALRTQLSRPSAEQAHLVARVEEQERERDRLVAAHQLALADAETSTREALAELRAQLAQALAEQTRLAARAEEPERARDLMMAEHQRAVADLEISNREVVAQLRASQTQLAQATAEQSRLAARVEEHGRDRERLIAEHQRTLAGLETSKRDALAELRAQLAQAFADQGRLAARADEHDLEMDRMRAEHYRALADLETRKRDALAQLRSQLSQVMAKNRLLAAHAEEHERERDRMSTEHDLALAGLEASTREALAIADIAATKREALAEVRSQLSQAVTDNRLLAARAEEHERERERMIAEHQRAITELQASKLEVVAELRAQLSQAADERIRMTVLYEEHERQRREAVAECERLLIEVEQSLLVRNSVDVVERGLADAIDEGARAKAEGERFARLQGGLTQAFSGMKAVLADEEVLREPSTVEHDESERPSTWTAETIDDAAATLAEAEPARITDAQTGPTLPADVQVPVTPTVAETPTETSAAALPDGLFDAEDDAFVRHIVEVTREPAPFDAEDDSFVRHLLEGPCEPALPPDSTDPPAGSAHAESGMQTVTTGDGSLPDMFDAEHDTFARHLFPPEDS